MYHFDATQGLERRRRCRTHSRLHALRDHHVPCEIAFSLVTILRSFVSLSASSSLALWLPLSAPLYVCLSILSLLCHLSVSLFSLSPLFLAKSLSVLHGFLFDPLVAIWGKEMVYETNRKICSHSASHPNSPIPTSTPTTNI